MVSSLAYIGFETPALDEWQEFGSEVLGAQVVNRADGLGLRIDDRVERIMIHPGERDNLAYFGWDCADDAAIDEMIGRLIRAKIATTEESELAAVRQVERLVSFTDPFGFRHELTTTT
ncbi:MAG: hypothetical protein L7T83_01510 [Ilumatobacteraceae bacterium]|nr:hypothetical protein [Ilumatobacteraceae bacterium]